VKDHVTCFLFVLFVCALYTGVQADGKTVGLNGQVHAVGLSRGVPDLLSYQGYLMDAADSAAVSATLEMTFRLFDSETKGAEVWSETHTAVDVSDGLFSVLLGSQTAFPAELFDGSSRWLQTEVGTEVLSPRKPIVSTAYSHRSEEADHAAAAESADDALQLEGHSLTDLDDRWVNEEDLDHLNAADGDPANALYVDSGGKVGVGTTAPLTELDVSGAVNATTYYGDGSNLTGVTGTTDDDWTIDGDDIYHQTGNVGVGTMSPAARLDVNGSINTDSVYQIDGQTVLRISANRNSFLGIATGGNTKGSNNTFVGAVAGSSHAGGSGNTFVGARAGSRTASGGDNTFIGSEAGQYNTTGHTNTFVGGTAGRENTTGQDNTFIGYESGTYNTSGRYNTFLGSESGYDNTSGQYNTFAGESAGNSNQEGDNNTYLGTFAGMHNVVGDSNVFLGHEAGYHEEGSNKLYIANSKDSSRVIIYGDFSTGNVGLGTLSPAHKLDVAGDISAATYYGDGSNLTGISGTADGDWTIAGDHMYSAVAGSVGIGTTAPQYLLDVNGDIRAAGILYGTADNADKVDGYHVSDLDGRYVDEGQSNSVTGGMIADGEVDQADIATDAVGRQQLDDTYKAQFIRVNTTSTGEYLWDDAWFSNNRPDITTTGTAGEIYFDSHGGVSMDILIKEDGIVVVNTGAHTYTHTATEGKFLEIMVKPYNFVYQWFVHFTGARNGDYVAGLVVGGRGD
jgi:hypothetical protein